MGTMYERGIGAIKRNYKQALQYFMKAADEGSTIARSAIMNIYTNGS
jgi:TPR repeat protein